MLPIQITDVSLAQQIRFAGEGVTVILGLAISYIALRGYRRNRSLPMLFVAVGFFLVVGVPAILFVVFLAAPVTQDAVSLGIQASEIAGMASILYGLRVDPD